MDTGADSVIIIVTETSVTCIEISYYICGYIVAEEFVEVCEGQKRLSWVEGI